MGQKRFWGYGQSGGNVFFNGADVEVDVVVVHPFLEILNGLLCMLGVLGIDVQCFDHGSAVLQPGLVGLVVLEKGGVGSMDGAGETESK